MSLAFLGALVGSLTRPWGGRLADRYGGARMTVLAFAMMAIGAGALVAILALENFWIFLACFLLLFTATGIGNGATYRMIPNVFAARGAVTASDTVGVQRKSAAALGLISAIDAYGGFLVPQVLSASQAATDGYTAAFLGFIAVYLVMLAITFATYVIPRRALDRRAI